MPLSDYRVALYAPDGVTEIAYDLKFTTLQYTNRIMDKGAIALSFPMKYLTVSTVKTLARDARVVVWRKPTDAIGYQVDFSGVIRGLQITLQGQELYIELRGFSQNEITFRRIIDAAAESDDALKNDYADDMAKAFVREQMGALATDTDRDLTDAGFAVSIDLSDATTIEKAAAHANLYETLQEIAEQSRTDKETMLFWGFVPVGDGLECEFRTKVGTWGQDLTESVVFSLENGNMLKPRYTFDASEEITYVYGGGAGTEDLRIEGDPQYDQGRIDQSPLNRRENFYDLRNESDVDVLTSSMADMLEEAIPVEMLDFDILETSNCRYQVNYHLGDKVRAVFAGITQDYHITAVGVTVAGGQDDTKIVLEVI